MAAPSKPAAVFISYNHDDRAWRDRIASNLKAAGLEVLDDTNLLPGQYWETELQRMRETANVAVLIITANFLASSTIRRVELPHLLELQRAKQHHLIPVIAEPCDWQQVEELRSIQAFSQGGIPLSKKSESEIQNDLLVLAQLVRAWLVNVSPSSEDREPFEATIQVAPPIIAKSFGARSIPLNGTITLTFNITNPNQTLGLTGISFTDNLPEGLVVSSPNELTSSCGGSITASPGSNTITLSGGLLEAGGSGTVTLNVTGKTPGTKANSVAVSSGQTGNETTRSNAAVIVVETQPANGLARNVALRLSVKRPEGMYLAMASQISPALAVTPYHVISESGVLQDRALQIQLEFLALPGATRATVLATDEANDIALLQHAPTGAFPEVESLIPEDSTFLTDEWETYLYDGSNVRGRVGKLVTYQGRSYRLLGLASPVDLKVGISGAPIICNGQLIGIAAFAYTDGLYWYAVPISEGVINSLTSSSKQKKTSDWLDQATIDRFSQDVRHILQTGNQLRIKRNEQTVHTVDLLMALAQDKNGQFAALLTEAKITENESLRRMLLAPYESSIEEPADFKGIPAISPGSRRALNIARDKANELGPSANIEVAHLLYGLLSVTGNKIVQALNQSGITPDKVKLPGRDQAETKEPEKKTAPALADYDSDGPAGTDLLDLKNEVNALASVMAARDVEPPLSLGLFGDWGSGKSFFMGQLERRICELQDDARDANGESSYCKDIVQLTFNAWTYIDADLWANLAAGIFEGLAAEMAKKRGGDSQAERALVLAAASSSQQVLAEAEKQKAQAEEQLKQFEERVAELQKNESTVEAKLSPKVLLTQAAQFAIEQEEVQRFIGNAAKQLHIDEAKAIGGEVKSQILELRGIWGTLVYTMRNNEKLWIWGLAFLVAVGAGWGATKLLTTNLLKDYVNVVAAHVIALLTAISGLLAPFLVIARRALSFIQGARESQQKHIDEAKRKKTAELEQEKNAIHAEVEKAKTAVGQATENVRKLNDQLEKMRADRKLADYIRQRNESSDYSQHLGVIARVRSDFRQLSILLRDARQESEKEAVAIKKRQEEKDQARRLFPRIDRIILYIDDLDRCPEKNVVEVLQAVHLLLAFPLFVVVVGVDPRWLLHSLRQHSTAFQSEAEAEEDRESREATEWESTPMNYLEKIFQIPFTLRPLGKAGFENFVDTFATPKETKMPQIEQGAEVPTGQPAQALSAAAAASGAQPGTVAPTSPGVPNAQESVVTSPAPMPVSQTSTLQQTQPQPESSAQPAPSGLQREAASTTPSADPIDRNPEHLRIEEWERAFMKTLYEFIPSPRASKRFINIYRLLRASVEESERDQFVGDQKQGEYRCAQMLLAILTGYPEEACDLLGRLIETKPSCSWGELLEEYRANPQLQPAAKKQSQGAKNGKEHVQAANQSEAPVAISQAQQWAELLAKLERLGDNNLYKCPCSGFNNWAPRVARYSFQSGRVLLRQRS